MRPKKFRKPLETYGSEPIGYWKDVPGHEGFQASVDGKIRRCYKSGFRLLSQYKKHNKPRSSMYFVKIGETECNAARLIYRTFYGDIPAGKYVCHKDGVPMNNAPYNLVLLSRSEIGSRHGPRGSSKSVLQCNPCTGETVKIFRSARQAGIENFMSYQTVADRCNGKTKYAGAPDGMEYCWEDDKVSYKEMMKRIERGKQCMKR